MRCFRIFFGAGMLAGGALGQSASCSGATVGFQPATFGNLRVAVWYPSSTPEAPYSYSDKLTGSVALNGSPAACIGAPLVVFSHGFGGCGTQSVFITEQLARNGYVVAAPDHSDATCSASGTASGDPAVSQAPFTDPDSWTPQTYANRRADIVNTIDAMLASPLFGAMIDPSKIGGMGHSLGGYTILGLAGGWHSWIDPRIKAAVLLSPYSQPFLAHNTLGGVGIPVQYQGGTLDIGVTPWIQKNSGAYDTTPPTKFFLNLRAAGHFVWSNVTCSSAGTVADCLKTSTNAKLINSYAFAFLDHYLRGMKQPLLWSAGTGLDEYRRESVAAVSNAASLTLGAPVAAESIATLFSEGYAETLPAAGIAAADPLHPPSALGGVQVAITDAKGTTKTAPLYFVSPAQINFVLPPNLAPGTAAFAVRTGDSTPALGTAAVALAAPGIFTTNASGRSLAVGQTLTVTSSGRTVASLAGSQGAVPVKLGEGDVYLILYATGLRGGTTPVSATAGGTSLPVLYALPQPEFPGLDQVALGPLPVTLAGRDLVPVTIEVSGIASNSPSIAFR
jgi:uncharacterized protein (TIGR03437 family)